MRTLFPVLVLCGILGLTAAHSQSVCGPGESHVTNSAGAKFGEVVIPDDGEYCVSAQGARRLAPIAVPQRQPHIDSVMTPDDRVLIVEALTKAGSPLAKAYSQGAPLVWSLVPEIEAALKAFGTPEAMDLISRIEAMRPKPRAELEPVDVPPHPKLTFEDGYRETWAETHGPTFALTLSNSEVNVVRRALDKTAEEHDKNHDVFDDYWMGRRQRVSEEINQGGFGLFVGGPDGWEDRQEKTFPLTLLEITLIGIAVSRDRYCRAEDQDIGELDFLTAGVECYIRNSEAVALFGRLEKAQHITPGGANGK